MKMMRTISTPRARRRVVSGIVVAALAALFSVVALVAALRAGSTVSVVASPQPPAAQVARTARVAKSGAGPMVRGYRVPWEMGTRPGGGTQDRSQRPAQTALVGGAGSGILSVLCRGPRRSVRPDSLRRRTGGASKGGAHAESSSGAWPRGLSTWRSLKSVARRC